MVFLSNLFGKLVPVAFVFISSSPFSLPVSFLHVSTGNPNRLIAVCFGIIYLDIPGITLDNWLPVAAMQLSIFLQSLVSKSFLDQTRPHTWVGTVGHQM